MGADHGIPLIYSVLEGKGEGLIYVDSVSDPQNALLLPQGGFFYLASKDHSRNFLLQMKKFIFQELMPAMTEKEMVLFALNEQTGKALDEIMADKGVIRIQRTLFDFDEKMYHEIQKAVALPDGYKVVRMEDAQLREYETAGNLGVHLPDRIGYRVVKGEEVISQCISVFTGGGQAEIDICTCEGYRRKGFAMACAFAFIDECLSKGLVPVWSCWPFRTESAALAGKLGFDEKGAADAHFWTENM
ncbi:GNAT family N-acetyltransferase [Eisenbergiella sp.]